MSRRKAATKREILPDSKYHNLVVAKCINVVMWDGKKEVAENIVYCALEKLKPLAKDGKDELALFLEAVDALNGQGGAFKKKIDTHKMAEANKAFAHFRW